MRATETAYTDCHPLQVMLHLDGLVAAVIAFRAVVFLVEDIVIHLRQHRTIAETLHFPAALAALIPKETFVPAKEYAIHKSSFALWLVFGCWFLRVD